MINVVAGLGLLSFITIFCDFILLNYVSERNIVSELSFVISNQVVISSLYEKVKNKKFEVLDYNTVFKGLFTIMSTVTNTTVATKWDPQVLY